MDRVKLYMAAFDEVDRLKKENEELKQWEWRTKLLERKVVQLRSLLNAVEEPALAYATGRVTVWQMVRTGIVFDVIGFFLILAALRVICPVMGWTS